MFDHMNAKVNVLYQKIDSFSITPSTSVTPTLVASLSPATLYCEICGVNGHTGRVCQMILVGGSPQENANFVYGGLLDVSPVPTNQSFKEPVVKGDKPKNHRPCLGLKKSKSKEKNSVKEKVREKLDQKYEPSHWRMKREEECMAWMTKLIKAHKDEAKRVRKDPTKPQRIKSSHIKTKGLLLTLVTGATGRSIPIIQNPKNQALGMGTNALLWEAVTGHADNGSNFLFL
ncbi:hypothetical protein KIW84_033781 [Lathyrus oleraceus]|uniref:Uncharacterized protein n=1 Tax=Pisum sativum TaxID=3888 RepID=A0A9D5B486_PEA|nr:hypothetical protein KIW84_033781 [Pisum sativum]